MAIANQQRHLGLQRGWAGEWNDVAQARLEKALSEPKRGCASNMIALPLPLQPAFLALPAPVLPPVPLPAPPGHGTDDSSSDVSEAEGERPLAPPAPSPSTSDSSSDDSEADSAVAAHPMYTQLMDEYEEQARELEKVRQLLAEKESEVNELVCMCQQYEHESSSRPKKSRTQ